MLDFNASRQHNHEVAQWDFKLRVWGYIFYNDGKASLSGIEPHIRKQARSPVFVCLNFRLLKFRSTLGGSLRSSRPPAGLGFRI